MIEWLEIALNKFIQPVVALGGAIGGLVYIRARVKRENAETRKANLESKKAELDIKLKELQLKETSNTEKVSKTPKPPKQKPKNKR
ncbi:MAG: hypothetical protein FWG68_11265 [Defluviitaleaceae bacterium]|nr:hypothetical protein [Defluviitaleaceae bacterium]